MLCIRNFDALYIYIIYLLYVLKLFTIINVYSILYYVYRSSEQLTVHWYSERLVLKVGDCIALAERSFRPQ